MINEFNKSICIVWLRANKNIGNKKKEKGSRRCNNVSRSNNEEFLLSIPIKYSICFDYLYKTTLFSR